MAQQVKVLAAVSGELSSSQESPRWTEKDNSHSCPKFFNAHAACMCMGTSYKYTTVLTKGHNIRSWHDGAAGRSTCHTSPMLGSPESMF